MIKRIINFLMFVDLPIRKKFLLFSLGVFIWFAVMYVMSIATLIDIHSKTTRIVSYDIPHDRIATKITRKLQNIMNDSAAIQNASDTQTLSKKSDAARGRTEDIRAFLSALMMGGQISDINRDTGKVIESFTVATIKGDAEGEKYAKSMMAVVDLLGKKNQELADLKIDILNKRIKDEGQLSSKVSEYQKIVFDAIMLSIEFAAQTAQLYAVNSKNIYRAIFCTSSTITGVMVLATALLVLFTFWISGSIAKPVNSIIEQIRALSEGELDLTKKIIVSSKDEIGTLSMEFNGLIESIHGISAFKNVIEEDDSIEDVYSRLGKIFKDDELLDEVVIFEVNNSQNKMRTVFPLLLAGSDMYCSEDILLNADLCRAKKTGHNISSMEYPGICKQFRSDTGKHHLCIPMIIGGSTGGIVQFICDREKQGADMVDRRIYKANQFIRESLSVLEAKRLMNTLRESALKDPLTGLYNRRFLQEYTETLVAGNLRRGKNIGLIMCDLDYFKQVNDVYGHNVGDMVLRETSGVIKKSVRESDLVIRFGGEEFLVVLMDIQEGDTMKVSEKIRTNMEETRIKVTDGVLKKTISLGISEFPSDTQSFWQAIKFADVALYKAKETGRNRVVRFVMDMWQEEQF
jgi:diguanylate cyclase (GGDEF)-like protein